jgi:hypothetical protein
MTRCIGIVSRGAKDHGLDAVSVSELVERPDLIEKVAGGLRDGSGRHVHMGDIREELLDRAGTP